MKSMKTIPAKAVSDLLVWETMIGVWSDFIGLLGGILAFLSDLFDFFGGGSAE